MGDQLTLIDLEMLGKIQPGELQCGAWCARDKATRVPNVVRWVQRFNQFSGFVCYDVLSGPNPLDRAGACCIPNTQFVVLVSLIDVISDRIRFWIAVMVRCRHLHNFHSAKAVLSGLSQAPLRRMTATWSLVNQVRV